jgi:serine carboxypeptidase-like clade 2
MKMGSSSNLWVFLLFGILSVCSLSSTVLTTPPPSLPQPITSLPGLSTPPSFQQFSGYSVVNETSGAELFYWFVESQSNPETDPVVLWLNGGPGCSSLLGMLTENGPFQLQSDGETILFNPYSWNQMASIIYLESPSGVGFSFSQNGDYLTGDNATAAGNYQFLLNFFGTYFPQYQSNPFYIAGEVSLLVLLALLLGFLRFTTFSSLLISFS